MVVKGVRELREGRTGSLELADTKLLYRERINNKDLLYSMRKYIQHPIVNHNGKEHEKYIYNIYLSNDS